MVESLAERYQHGDHEAVWQALSSVDARSLEPSALADAERVAELTMDRVAANLATLVVRLTLMGYRFGSNYSANLRRRSIEDLGLRDSMAAAGRDVEWIDKGDVEESVMGWAGPGADIEDRVGRAEKLVGPLPLPLRSLILRVDSIDLAGSFPSWVPSAFNFDEDLDWPPFGVVSDALALTPIEVVEDYVNPATGEIHRDFLRDGLFGLTVMPDHRLTANFAGGFITTALPSSEIDPVLDGVHRRPGVRLIAYLREVFAWGGFPGFAFASTVPPEIDVLRRDLLSF